jgi:regulation of enolase protein 1 (concanavalin A-like superfamily)
MPSSRGGLALDADRWVRCKPRFFLPVRVLSKVVAEELIGWGTAPHGAPQQYPEIRIRMATHYELAG